MKRQVQSRITRALIPCAAVLIALALDTRATAGAQASRTVVASVARGDVSLGQTVRDSLTSTAPHAWGVVAAPGDVIEIEVLPRSDHVRLRIVTPDGAVRRVFDPVRIAQGVRPVRWIAGAAGRWVVEVGLAEGSKAASYELRWAGRRPPSDADRALVTADSLNVLGSQLQQQGRDTAALSLLNRALALREAGGDDAEIASTLQEIANLHFTRRRYDEAESLAVRALTIRERRLGPGSYAVSRSLGQLAVINFSRSRLPRADSLFRRALTLSQRALGRAHRDNVDLMANLGGLLASSRRYGEADSLLRDALAIAEREFGAEDRRLLRPLNNLAFSYEQQERAAEAEQLYRRLLVIREGELGAEHVEVARLLGIIAGLNEKVGRYADAEPQRRRALAVLEKAYRTPHNDLARGLMMVGWNLHLQGRAAEAEPLARRSVVMFEATSGAEHVSVAEALQNLAIVTSDQARYAEAERMHQRALAIKEKALGPDHLGVAGSLNDLALVYAASSRGDLAEPLFRRSLAIRESRLGTDHLLVAQPLTNLALLYVSQARYVDAEALYRRALAIDERRLGPEHPTTASALSNLGILYQLQRRYDAAAQLLNRAYAIKVRVLGRAHPNSQITLRYLGRLAVDQRRYAEAESTFKESIRIAETSSGVGGREREGSWLELADLYRQRRRYAEAAPLYQRRLQDAERLFGPVNARTAGALLDVAQNAWLWRGSAAFSGTLLNRSITIFDGLTPGSFSPLTRIRAYSWRARVRKATGDRTRAIADLAEAIRSIEELRPQIGGNEESRAEFWGRYSELFDLMVAWRLESADVGAALEYAERGRARVLLDQLTAGKIDLRQSIPSDVRSPLEAREGSARARLAEYQERVTRLAMRTDIGADERVRQTAVAADSLRAAERDVRAVYDDIKNASSLWRDLITSGGQPVSLATIQRNLVPQRGLLAMYQIGADRSFLFLLPASGAPSVVNLRITSADARTLGVRPGVLTADALQQALGMTASSGSAGIVSLLGQAPRGAVSAAVARASVRQLHALRGILMPDSVWNRIKGVEQMVIIPGRGLYQLPFEALVVTMGVTDAETRYWLDDGPAIRYAASATTLYNLEQRPRLRVVDSPDQKAVVSLSAPLFDGSSSTVGAPTLPDSVKLGVDSRGESPVTRSSFVDGGGVLAPLPGTASETEAIRAAFGVTPSSGAVFALQGREATEANLRPALLGTRFIHLATHGLIDESRGALFAALALTPPSTATANDDGFLQLHEIYQLRLPEAELAVLSACATNVGTAIESEGVFALSRGFLAAGARRVIASQWAVDDRSTAELMGGFFRAVAVAEQGGRTIDYTQALRDAKLALRRDPKWASPYFWAPFVLTGAR